jgi:hypothetical protein
MLYRKVEKVFHFLLPYFFYFLDFFDFAANFLPQARATCNTFIMVHRLHWRLFQNFSFGTATLDLREKRASDRFSQEPVPKLTEFWNRLTD